MVLTISIDMAFAISRTETVTIKAVFFAIFAMASINVCFNVSFLDFNHIVNKNDNFRGSVHVFALNHSYQYSYCSQ